MICFLFFIFKKKLVSHLSKFLLSRMIGCKASVGSFLSLLLNFNICLILYFKNIFKKN